MKIRILIFEDHDEFRSLITDISRGLGYEVISFSNPSEIGRDIHSKYVAGHADIVISDMNMPFMNGMELVDKLAEAGFDMENVALMSGFWFKESRLYAKERGIKMFVKPFSLFDLIDWFEERECHIKNDCIMLDYE